MSGDVRANWLSNYLANPALYEGKIKIGDETKFTYREEMYEIKLSIEVASKMVELYKIDDSKLHSIFQFIMNKYEAFDRKCLEIENRMVKYNQHLSAIQSFVCEKQRYFKRSKDREIELEEFMAINLHLQCFSIGQNFVSFNTVTCGAAAAHTKGFKGDGLWKSLQVTMNDQDTDHLCGRKASSIMFERHTTATALLLKIRSLWGDIVEAIELMKSGQMNITSFVLVAKSMLSIIADCVRNETDDKNSKAIRESCRMCFGIIKSGQESLSPTDFAQTVKTPLQKAYSECLEFLIFRALSVIVDDSIQRRLDIIQSNVIAIGVASILSFVGESSRTPEDVIKLKATGLLVNFESLLSEYGKEIGMMSDYAFGVHFLLDKVTFALTSNVSELTIEGSRLDVKVQIPCTAELLVGGNNPDGDIDVAFKIVPIFFNIGINEKQSIQDAMHRTPNQYPSLIDDINKYSLYRFYEWISNQLPTDEANIIVNGKLHKIKEEVYARKKKNVEIHKLVSDLTRNIGGARVVNCKSGKDRTGMAVTLEQTRAIQYYCPLPDAHIQSIMDDMRMNGVRRENCRKNLDRYLYAFQGIQLQTFPLEYRPPKGSYGHAQT